jgi:hypothetical protein
LAVSYPVEQDACLQEVLIASFLAVLVAYLVEGAPCALQVVVVPYASQEEGGRHLSLEVEGVEGASRPWQSSYGKAGDAMKESGR